MQTRVTPPAPQGCKFLPGPDLVTMDANEAVDKLRIILRVLAAFKSFYFDYKDRSAEVCPENPWKFQNNTIFSRLDAFMERCHDMLDLQITCTQFLKLDRIEIGGTKGKVLTAGVKQLHEDFTHAVEQMQAVDYDVLDVDAHEFDEDFFVFRTSIKELERRLSSIIMQVSRPGSNPNFFFNNEEAPLASAVPTCHNPLALPRWGTSCCCLLST